MRWTGGEVADRRQLIQRLRDGPGERGRGPSASEEADGGNRELDVEVRHASVAADSGPVRELPPRAPCTRTGDGGVQAADGGPGCAANGDVIRGRSKTPGRAADSGSWDVGVDAGVQAVPIRGPCTGLGPSIRGHSSAAYPGNVAKRRPLPRPGEGHAGAAERSSALRRRIGVVVEENAVRVGIPVGDKPAAVAGAPHSKTIEVSKIHLASLEEQAGGGCSTSSATSGSSACSHAAADAAWHGRELLVEARQVTRASERRS